MRKAGIALSLLTVARIRPLSPTIQPVIASRKWTSRKFTLVPLVCIFQLLPPLVVARIVPLLPTNQPVLALSMKMPYSAAPAQLVHVWKAKPGVAIANSSAALKIIGV